MGFWFILLLLGTDKFYLCDYILLFFLPMQAKFLYGKKFSAEEMLDLKLMIQINVYKYLSTLLEWRECFEDEAFKEDREFCMSDKDSGESDKALPDTC